MPRRQPAFVLLLVVITLAITCIILSQLALLHFSTVRQAITYERQIQDHWDLVSIRKAVFESRRRALTDLSGVKPQASCEIRLNDAIYRLSLQDENAKINLNHALKRWAPQHAQQLLAPLNLRSSSVHSLRRSEPFGSWSQLGMPTESINKTVNESSLTLWGNGRLNLMSADPAVIETVWKALFGTSVSEELLALREHWPPLPWNEVRSTLGLRETQLEKADEWFTTSSDCYSLRVSLMNDGSSTKQWLFVRSGDLEHRGFRL